MDDVAARAGVSRAAVSLAFSGSSKVSAARREQILRVAAELGFRPNSHASRLARASTGVIGIVISDLHNSLYADVVDGLRAGVGGGPEQLLLAPGFHDVRQERSAVESFLSYRVDGLALVGTQLPEEEVQKVAAETPTVVVGRRVPGVDWLAVDDSAGAELATQHLIDLGHTSIGHIDGGGGAGAALRRAEFLHVMSRNGLTATAMCAGGDYTEEGGRAAAQRLLGQPSPPTAIFAANDLSALGVLAAARARGIAVPSQLAVIGFDNTEMARYHAVGLSTIDYQRTEMGRGAVPVLRRRAAAPEKDPTYTVLACSLLARETTVGATPV